LKELCTYLPNLDTLAGRDEVALPSTRLVTLLAQLEKPLNSKRLERDNASVHGVHPAEKKASHLSKNHKVRKRTTDKANKSHYQMQRWLEERPAEEYWNVVSRFSGDKCRNL
jgi:hypothetical protein